MGDSGPFLSSLSRRQLARRRSGRVRYAALARFVPALLAASVVLVATAAFLAGHGGL